MLKKTFVLSAAVLGFLAFAAGPAASQDPGYPDTDVFSASIDDTTVEPGQTVTISGVCEAGDEVGVSIVGEGTIGTIPVADDDSFSGEVTIPSDLDPGTSTIVVTCGDAELSIDITVSADGAGGNGNGGGGGAGGNGVDIVDGALPRTGSPAETLVKVGGGLLLAGAAVALFATKRRSITA